MFSLCASSYSSSSGSQAPDGVRRRPPDRGLRQRRLFWLGGPLPAMIFAFASTGGLVL